MLRLIDSVPKIRSVGIQAGIYRGSDSDNRPSLADQHKVGFFTLDRCSQTDVTEVVDLKEMTEIIQILLQDVTNLRRDINFAKHVMQADYEKKLQEKALELYCRINDKVAQLERMHEDRVDTVRRAFRQQLADAIARISVLYNKNMETKILREKSKRASDKDKQGEQYKEMQATLMRNQQVIAMLKTQLAHYQQQKTEIESVEDLSIKSKSPEINPELDELREEVSGLSNKINKMEKTLDQKDENINGLNQELDQLKQILESEKANAEQFKRQNETMKANAEQEQASSRRLLQRQKQEMERLMEEKMRAAREEALQQAREDANKLQDLEQNKLKVLMDQKKRLEDMLLQEKKKSTQKSQHEVDGDKLRRNEDRFRDEITRLKGEIEKIHKIWEKKFAILQQSMHALKDESYIRQTLQRQAATLHHAAVSYAADAPVGIMSSGKHGHMKKPIIPDIPKKSPRNGNTPNAPGAAEKDYISYTVSAPSGRGTAMMSVDEHQIMSEGEQELPSDIAPLPDPPTRRVRSPQKQAREDGEEVEETEKQTPPQGHIVVVPSRA